MNKKNNSKDPLEVVGCARGYSKEELINNLSRHANFTPHLIKQIRELPEVMLRNSGTPTAKKIVRMMRDISGEAYRAILQRTADEGGFRDFLEQLKTHKITRHQLIEILMNSDEYRDLTILYDLENNPVENSNIYSRGRFDEAWKQFQVMQEKIEMIESTSAGFKPEPVISQSNEDKQKMEAHLKSLGYL